MTDIEQGREALRHFHNASIKYDAYNFENLDELTSVYGNKRDIYLDGIGMLIRETGISSYAIESAMQELAKKSEGKIPKDHQGYMNALGNKAGQVSYLDLSKVVAEDVARQATDGLVSIGNSVTTSLSWLTKILPFLVVGGAVLFVLKNTNQKVGTDTIRKATAKVKSKYSSLKKKAAKA
jgi:hypothetical protein